LRWTLQYPTGDIADLPAKTVAFIFVFR